MIAVGSRAEFWLLLLVNQLANNWLAELPLVAEEPDVVEPEVLEPEALEVDVADELLPSGSE